VTKDRDRGANVRSGSGAAATSATADYSRQQTLPNSTGTEDDLAWSLNGGLLVSAQKRLLLELAAGLTSNDFARVEAWFANDFRLHDPALPGWPTGYEGALLMLTEIRGKVPGARVEALDMVEEGDRVAVRWLFSATLEGEARQLSAVAIYRFSNGLISEDWGIATRASWP